MYVFLKKFFTKFFITAKFAYSKRIITESFSDLNLDFFFISHLT